MSFPRRPNMDNFGPDLRNPKVVTNPETQADANLLNLIRFQVAGMGLTALRAWAVIDSTGGVTPALLMRSETWNPRLLSAAPYTPPVPGRTSQGVLTLQYAGSYPDRNGVLQSLSIAYPVAFPVGTTNVRHAAAVVTGSTITVRLREFDSGDFALIDGPVLVGFL